MLRPIRTLFLVLIPTFIVNLASASASPPVLYFQEAWNLDAELCPSGVQDASEARKAIPTLDADWKKHGKIFLKETEKLVGKSWMRKELSFHYHVCPDIPDLSSPLSIQMAPLIHSTRETRGEILVGMRDTVWHELLHLYIASIIDVTSLSTPLLIRHRSENNAVRTHLHLMALQQKIYRDLRRPRDAEIVRTFYLNNLPDYFKAWELVRKDGPELYISELRSR